MWSKKIIIIIVIITAHHKLCNKNFHCKGRKLFNGRQKIINSDVTKPQPPLATTTARGATISSSPRRGPRATSSCRSWRRWTSLPRGRSESIATPSTSEGQGWQATAAPEASRAGWWATPRYSGHQDWGARDFLPVDLTWEERKKRKINTWISFFYKNIKYDYQHYHGNF